MTDCPHTPSGVSVPEADVLAAIERTAKVLGKKFAFGMYGPEDIRSLVAVYTYEALAAGRYDPTRPIGPFVFSNARNRLLNLHRKERRRTDVPCARCHAGDPCGPDGGVCRVYGRWATRQKVKENISRPVGIDQVSDKREQRTREESPVEASAEANELEAVIDLHLPVELRGDYMKMRVGEVLPRIRRERVQEAVLDALESAGLGVEDFGL